MADPAVIVEKDGHVLTVTLNRPEKYNTLRIEMIQELETREAVLIQSHKMRAVGTLTAGVAHELNNPLNNITLTAAMLDATLGLYTGLVADASISGLP